MNFDDYQKKAMRTKGGHNDLTNAALGLAGESGEALEALIRMGLAASRFADTTKKHVHYKHELNRVAVLKELGDVLWYLALAADQIGVSLEHIAAVNVAKLEARYPDGFSAEASKHNGA